MFGRDFDLSKKENLSPTVKSNGFKGNNSGSRVTPNNEALLNSLESSKNKSVEDLFSRKSLVHNSKDKNKKPLKQIYDDRFIPKPITNIALARDTVVGLLPEPKDDPVENLELEKKMAMLRICVSEPDLSSDRILSFTRKAPVGFEAGMNNATRFMKTSASKPKWKLHRFIPRVSERVLDAPNLRNDFYLNLLHWGCDNTICIGLNNTLFTWKASTGAIGKFDKLFGDQSLCYISSVRWSGQSSSSCLALGGSDSLIQIWDVRYKKCLRTLRGHSGRVSSLSWNQNILSSGSRSGIIINYDVRIKDPEISRLTDSHSQEVCGLSWSADGTHLASGGNDNQVFVWDKSGLTSGTNYVHNFSSHQGAVKAVSWCPYETNVLATGGGSADRTVNFWNVSNGTNLSSLNTGSAVTGIIWNPYSSEFVTSHGGAQNHLLLWSYPSMQLAGNMNGHDGRVLGMVLSPDGTTIASCGADETLRFWRCFEQDEPKNKSRRPQQDTGSSSKRIVDIR